MIKRYTDLFESGESVEQGKNSLLRTLYIISKYVVVTICLFGV